MYDKKAAEPAACLLLWRNRQTRDLKSPGGNTIRVRFPSAAPYSKAKGMPHGMPFAVRRKTRMREFVITDASMPRLDSALLAQYPQLSPAGCTSICVKTKSRWMEKSFRSLHACHAAAPCVFFCRICFWISRTARYFFPQGLSCAPFMKTATNLLPTSPPDFL